jgi:TetR/AcrR family transcriptional regulator, cholesterol catabolism regulator
MLVSEVQRSESRRAQILERAAHLFGERGYERTSIRDIASAVGMLPGSVYYHFASKEALLAAVYTAAIDQAIDAIQAATACHTDPWDRLEAAAVAHLGILVGGGSIAVVIADRPNLPETARADLIRQRHRYELVFRDLVAALDLPIGVQASSFRLALLGALNWALTWYRPDGDPPEAVARSLFAVFRSGRPSSTSID